jgi:hypothetical protein
MTLDRPIRDAVRDSLDVEVVPEEVVLAVEGDETLRHLAEARRSLRLVSIDVKRDSLARASEDVEREIDRRIDRLLAESGVEGIDREDESREQEERDR